MMSDLVDFHSGGGLPEGLCDHLPAIHRIGTSYPSQARHKHLRALVIYWADHLILIGVRKICLLKKFLPAPLPPHQSQIVRP